MKELIRKKHIFNLPKSRVHKRVKQLTVDYKYNLYLPLFHLIFLIAFLLSIPCIYFFSVSLVFVHSQYPFYLFILSIPSFYFFSVFLVFISSQYPMYIFLLSNLCINFFSVSLVSISSQYPLYLSLMIEYLLYLFISCSVP